ncbi:uncharacterized protein LOC144695333 isoform X3 [Cetorhinus maximus]
MYPGPSLSLGSPPLFGQGQLSAGAKMPMIPCPIPAFLLAACLFTAGIHSKAQEVKQTPPSASLVEGDSVTMNCIIDFTGPKIYKWLKNDLKTDQAISMYWQRVEEGMKDSKDQKLLPYLRIKNLTECDSGTYYCAAENLGRTLKGAGTKLAVTRSSLHTSPKSQQKLSHQSRKGSVSTERGLLRALVKKARRRRKENRKSATRWTTRTMSTLADPRKPRPNRKDSSQYSRTAQTLFKFLGHPEEFPKGSRLFHFSTLF